MIIESREGQLKATGVKCADGMEIKATREVVLCCGTYRTPQVLMLSGIGPKIELQKIGIPLSKDLPVG